MRTFWFYGASLSLILLLGSCATPNNSGRLGRSLTFYASFDQGPNADFALADRTLFSAANMKHPRTGKAGLPSSGVVTIAQGAGRYGDALQFHRKSSEMVFFQGHHNVLYRTQDWSGTVSVWLRTSREEDLPAGFCDPIQITPREWNDAAFFVEFEKRTNSIPFRLGAYADFKVWNPAGRDWSQIPQDEKPLVTVPQPPISRDRWMHVVFTWENFNTSQSNGVARLYSNGEFRGQLSPRPQTFTWDPEKVLVMLGLNYVGYLDELAIFDRALSAAEIRSLHQLPKGMADLGTRRQ